MRVKIDRNSKKDAQIVFERLIPENSSRFKIIEFLISAIEYTDNIDAGNWNLNLDKNGRFIQFNTGQEYCIKIMREEILILCDKRKLEPIINNIKYPIKYRGHKRKQRIHSYDINDVPDCLVKVEYSVGCLLPIKGIENYIDYFIDCNRAFIQEAMKTKINSLMRNAHSKGAIEYLAANSERIHNNSIYAIAYLPSLKEILEKEDLAVKKARKLSKEQRHERLNNYNQEPKRTEVRKSVYLRNEYVILEVLENANGKCQNCEEKAPFIKDSDGQPYLEVHHETPLAEGGKDTVDNAVALCPNCHRHAHYGKKTYKKNNSI